MKLPLQVFSFRVGAAIALLSLTLCSPAHAGAKKKPPYKPAVDLIKAVNQKAKTITIGYVNSKNQDVKTLRITDLTEIQVNGTDGPNGDMSRIHAGMRVDATLGTDTTTAERVVVTDAH